MYYYFITYTMQNLEIPQSHCRSTVLVLRTHFNEATKYKNYIAAEQFA